MSKHLKIIQLLSENISWFKTHSETTDYILFYRPKYGWYAKEIIGNSFGWRIHVGKNYEECEERVRKFKANNNRLKEEWFY